jgi:hypothetical protein
MFVEDVDAALAAVRMVNHFVLEQVDLEALSAAQNPKVFWSDLHGHDCSKPLTD